jgi:hypothetical protein
MVYDVPQDVVAVAKCLGIDLQELCRRPGMEHCCIMLLVAKRQESDGTRELAAKCEYTLAPEEVNYALAPEDVSDVTIGSMGEPVTK